MAMQNAAAALLHSLNEKQRNKTTFDFDHPHRVSCEFLPAAMIKRKGIALAELDKKQKMVAYGLLASDLSRAGNEKIAISSTSNVSCSNSPDRTLETPNSSRS
jgi:hypothetical protein